MAPYTPPSVGRAAPMAMLGWGDIIGYPGDGGLECQNFRNPRCQSFRNRHYDREWFLGCAPCYHLCYR